MHRFPVAGFIELGEGQMGQMAIYFREMDMEDVFLGAALKIRRTAASGSRTSFQSSVDDSSLLSITTPKASLKQEIGVSEPKRSGIAENRFERGKEVASSRE